MDYAWYLFSFEGRLGRARYWLAAPILICFGLFWLLAFGALAAGAFRLLGGTVSFSFNLGIEEILKLFDPAFYRSLSLASLPAVLFQTAGSILLVWIFSATTVKRLHDRDKSGWWMIPFFGSATCYNQFAEWLPDIFVLDVLLAVGMLALSIWGFAELYFVRGSRKTNRFGSDPLAQPDTRPRWEQMSEIEMVPREAGPPPVWRVKPGYE